MPRYDDTHRVHHMLDAARKAVEFCKDKTRADLDEDEMLILALVRLLEIIGEAAGRVSQQVRDQHNAIPWKPIMAARNRLIHGYAEVDLDVAWTIITDDLPPLINELEKLVFPETEGS